MHRLAIALAVLALAATAAAESQTEPDGPDAAQQDDTQGSESAQAASEDVGDGSEAADTEGEGSADPSGDEESEPTPSSEDEPEDSSDSGSRRGFVRSAVDWATPTAADGLVDEVEDAIRDRLPRPQGCKWYSWYSTEPKLQTDPFLGMIVLSPMDCINRIIDGPDHLAGQPTGW